MSMAVELLFLVEEAPEGGYTARALGEPIFTEADDLDQLRAMVRMPSCATSRTRTGRRFCGCTWCTIELLAV